MVLGGRGEINNWRVPTSRFFLKEYIFFFFPLCFCTTSKQLRNREKNRKKKKQKNIFKRKIRTVTYMKHEQELAFS